MLVTLFRLQVAVIGVLGVLELLLRVAHPGGGSSSNIGSEKNFAEKTDRLSIDTIHNKPSFSTRYDYHDFHPWPLPTP